MTVPDREQVTRTWTELISGAVTRAAAHAWAVRWVEDEPERVTDPMTGSALLHLHGFDQACTAPAAASRASPPPADPRCP
ncbi:hypothetical protein [Amycolatopsis sp. WQ 127309]|uniref:hypothetical protein n=1 Tax=Amycolatopsis sp. WQ 127309 TaxID=2932773 RepID=UPI001FF35728|nr:hypothetical protein [Amycolatopsis sp. WQ 127309]UOZ02790.1 hypothetical protein MUY22_28420 [Amycolatopsis sp. WQ 127309]